MNSLTDTLGTLMPDASWLVTIIMECSRRGFMDEGGSLPPCAFSVSVDGTPDVHLIQTDFTDETKPAVWAMVRELRKTRPVVAFISEVWVARCDKDGMNEDGSLKVMPRDNPNRTECLMLVLWQGPRHISITAEITRNPTHLGEWEVMFDSNFPVGEITSLGGNMMDGESYPMEAN